MKQLIRLFGVGLVLAVVATTPVLAATVEEWQRDYLNLVRAPQAQKITKGEGVVVAVMDSGVEADHPDLAGAVLPGTSFEVNSPRGQVDVAGHGTHMAGVIAARGGGYNNALGIAPRAKILPIALPGDDVIPSTAAIVGSIRYAADHGAKVLSMSLSMPEIDGSIDRQIVQAIAYAQAKDVVVVIASGNRIDSGSDNLLAKLPGVVSVSGVDSTGVPWSGGSTGMYVALAAPAVDIVNTGLRSVHPSGYSRATGTSE
jgi:subtilisin family serine protease